MEESDAFEVIRVDGESTAMQVLQAALEKAFENKAVKLDFDEWPVLKLQYTGEKFHGTITPDIAQAIVDLQEVLNRSYVLAVNNTLNRPGFRGGSNSGEWSHEEVPEVFP